MRREEARKKCLWPAIDMMIVVGVLPNHPCGEETTLKTVNEHNVCKALQMRDRGQQYFLLLLTVIEHKDGVVQKMTFFWTAVV